MYAIFSGLKKKHYLEIYGKKKEIKKISILFFLLFYSKIITIFNPQKCLFERKIYIFFSFISALRVY